MYGSSGQTLKMIVIELDGCLFSLNRYRFNFYKNLCTKKGISLSREMYYPGLGNMATMYDDLPLNDYQCVSFMKKFGTADFMYLGSTNPFYVTRYYPEDEEN